jgi:Zn-finger nucleic acid-binding protein
MDRGELDKILDNERAYQPGHAGPAQPAPPRDDYRERRRRDDDDDDDDYRRGRRRGGFSLFDIFD